MTGPECREIRKALGQTIRGFAAILEVSKTTIVQWEKHGINGVPDKLLTLLRDKPNLLKRLKRVS